MIRLENIGVVADQLPSPIVHDLILEIAEEQGVQIRDVFRMLNPRQRLELLTVQYMDERIQLLYLEEQDDFWHRMLAEHPQLCYKAQDRLMQRDSFWRYLASNPNLRRQHQYTITYHLPEYHVNEARSLGSSLARNPALCKRLQRHFLRHNYLGFPTYWYELAVNRSLIPYCQFAIALDGNRCHRYSLAIHCTSQRAQRLLARDPNESVRIALCRNKRLHPRVKEILRRDSSLAVREEMVIRDRWDKSDIKNDSDIAEYDSDIAEYDSANAENDLMTGESSSDHLPDQDIDEEDQGIDEEDE